MSHPTTLAAAQGTVMDDALPDTSSLLLGTGQGDKNCRTEEFIGTRKPMSVAYQHKQRNCLNREPHLEVLQSSQGSHSMWYMNPGSEPIASKGEQVYRTAARKRANKKCEGTQKNPI